MPDNLHISIVHLLQEPPACSVQELPRAPAWPQLQLLLLLQQLRFKHGASNTDFSAVRTPSSPATSQAYHLLVLLEQRAGDIQLRAAINRNQSQPGRDSTDKLHHSRLNHWERVGDCGPVPNC